MAYSNKAILVDVNGRPIPQVWDEAGDQFRPAAGDANGAQLISGDVTISGSNVPSKLAPSPLGNRKSSRNGPIAAGVVETLIDETAPYDVEAVTYGTDHRDVRLLIESRDPSGNYNTGFGIPAADGSTIYAVSPGNLQDHQNGENDFFKNFVFDDTDKRYSLGMKRQFKQAGGGRIRISNGDPANAHNVAVEVQISVFHS